MPDIEPELNNLFAQVQSCSMPCSVTTSARLQERLRTWSIYAAAAGSALALTTSAEASIIYSGVQDLTAFAYGQGTSFQTVDIDGKGNNFRLFIASHYSFFYGSARAGIRASGGGRQLLGTGINVRRLPAWVVLSNGVAGFGRSHSVLRGFYEKSARYTHSVLRNYGTWPDTMNTGFAGLKFTEGGQPHFGWIRLNFREHGFNISSITAIDWAYNDVAGAPILAGQTTTGSPVPEPGGKALALLAVGSIGLLALRKHRAAAN